MKVEKLKPFLRKADVTVKILKKEEVKETKSTLDNSQHKVCEVLVGDDSGTIILTVWDKTIDQLEEGKSYLISNAYTSMFKNSLRLNLGRFGKISESRSIKEINTENNLSDKIFE